MARLNEDERPPADKRLMDAVFVTTDEGSRAAVCNEIGKALDSAIMKMDTHNDTNDVRLVIEKVDRFVG